jgi:hypothetical protein
MTKEKAVDNQCESENVRSREGFKAAIINIFKKTPSLVCTYE